MRIDVFRTTETYQYLWLKYVTGFNLEVHCARCLLGNYSKRVGVDALNSGNMQMVELDEFPYKYIYLCGVTSPYRWERNLHIALEPCKGSKVVINECGVYAEISDAKRIEIQSQSVYYHPKGASKEFNTCRNWRFAYQQVNNFNT